MLSSRSNAHAPGVAIVHDRVCDLADEIFLDLKATRIGIDQTRELSEAQDAVPWLVGQVHVAEEGQEVVGAERVEADVRDLDETGLGFTVCAENSPIIAVRMASRDEAVHVWNRLFESGVYVNLAIPPGTPNGANLLRCSVSAAHTDAQIGEICDAFERVSRDLTVTEDGLSEGFGLAGTSG